MASEFSWATVAPVRTSVWSGTTVASRSGEVELGSRRRSALTSMVSKNPGWPRTFCAVAVSK